MTLPLWKIPPVLPWVSRPSAWSAVSLLLDSPGASLVGRARSDAKPFPVACALPGFACSLFWLWFTLIQVACAKLLHHDVDPFPLAIAKDLEGRH